MFHVTSSRNRSSIERYGLDWSRMTSAPGVAGSRTPEVDGVFLCPDTFTVQFFVSMNNTGGPVDVWAVDDVYESRLEVSSNGYAYLPAVIGSARLTLLERDLQPTEHSSGDGDEDAFDSSLTITLNDGTVLTGDAALRFMIDRET